MAIYIYKPYFGAQFLKPELVKKFLNNNVLKFNEDTQLIEISNGL